MISSIQHDDLFTPGQPLPMQRSRTHACSLRVRPLFWQKMGGATSNYAITTAKKFWTFMQTTTRQAWLNNRVLPIGRSRGWQRASKKIQDGEEIQHEKSWYDNHW